MTMKTHQTFYIYSQGITTKHELPTDVVDNAIRKFSRQGYICWKSNENKSLN